MASICFFFFKKFAVYITTNLKVAFFNVSICYTGYKIKSITKMKLEISDGIEIS